jgi:hypothetical protein
LPELLEMLRGVADGEIGGAGQGLDGGAGLRQSFEQSQAVAVTEGTGHLGQRIEEILL